ncbi:hypothetical protein AAF712_004525 [Marasmius tenuissimus]|uniref:G-protein coupled receptors family 2 profile 2 domain-containing protein n=1 Tax=Marasmius tenuissimus TaxID=585030 RepID=A0ABR3A386_9AGAR
MGESFEYFLPESTYSTFSLSLDEQPKNLHNILSRNWYNLPRSSPYFDCGGSPRIKKVVGQGQLQAYGGLADDKVSSGRVLLVLGMMVMSINFDGIGCAVQMWLLSFSVQLSSYLLFCIGLNLQLVMIHGLNGQKMEKYYLFGSFLLALGLSLPPLIAGQFGWDPIEQTCGWSSQDHGERLKWRVGTMLFWIVLTIVGEIITFSAVLVFMVRARLNRTGAEDVSSEIGRVLVVLCSFRPLVYAILAFWDPSLTRALKVLYYLTFEKGQLEQNEVAFTETRTERRRGCPGNAHSPTTTRMGHRQSGSSGPKTVEITIPAFALAPPPPPAYCLSLSSPSSASLASTVDPERGCVQPEDSFELGLGETFLEAESMRIVPWRISGMSGVGVGFISVERTPAGADAGEAEVEFGKLI